MIALYISIYRQEREDLNNYESTRIKNIALAGHGGSGKTSLTEALLFKSGATDRLGKISEGNTISDFNSEEIKRKSSIYSSLSFYEKDDFKINLIDTPGLFDYAGGMVEGIYASGCVMITVSGKSGVKVGTEKAYDCAVQYNKPRMFVVTKLDDANADFYKVLAELKSKFGPTVCPIVVPTIRDGKIVSYINLIEMKAYEYNDKGVAVEIEMPESEYRLDGLIAAISEAVAETDEELFEKYFSGEQFTQKELIKGIHSGMNTGVITPVTCVSSTNLAGIDMLMKEITLLLPTTNENEVITATAKNGDVAEVKVDDKSPMCAFVFKTVSDPFVGKMSFLKVISGQLKSGMDFVNATTGQSEKIGKLIALCGKKQTEVLTAGAGDIVVAAKLSVNTNDTICEPSRVLAIEPILFTKPSYGMAVYAKTQGDESKLSQGIQRILDEDKTLTYTQDPLTHEQILSGLGEQHLSAVTTRLKNEFGVDIELSVPQIAYRETIRKKVKVQGKHKKQSGGHGQYGDVWIEFEPCISDSLVFEERVFGGAVPRNFFPAVEKGLQECVRKGVLASFPVVGLKAILVDGSYHPVDSSEMAFKMAASIAYKEGLRQADPILLEPIGGLKVIVPDENTGDMMGELNKRRGRVLGMNPIGKGLTEIVAEVPMSQMHDFSMLLRQMSQGRGNFALEMLRYEHLPSQLVAEVIAKASALVD